MMFMKKVILFASIFAVICASKEQSLGNGYSGASDTIASHNVYSQQIQDNIAAESEVVSKRGASVTSSTSDNNAESQGESSQINVGSSNGSGSGGVISYSTPSGYQQFYSPAFGQFGQYFTAAALPVTSASSTTPQIFYVRAPQTYVAPSGVGTIKLTYTGNQAQPQTTIQYASTTPKMAYAVAPAQYQLAVTNPSTSAAYAAYTPIALAAPYTASTYANTPSAYTSGSQLAAASIQQGQIIPFTTAANSFLLSPSQLAQLQQYNYAVPQLVSPTAAAAYSTVAPIIPSAVPKIQSVIPGTAATPTAAAYYGAAPAAHSYQHSPAFLSYPNAASSVNYATAQKLVAVPYTQAYRPIVPPTAATSSASSYTNAYVHPTGIAPVKYTLAQPQSNYYGSPGTTYAQKLSYAPSSATPSPYVSSLHHQQQQTLQSVNAAISQAASANGAIQYGAQQYGAQQFYQPSTVPKYAQLPTPHKYFYASA